MKGLFIIHCQDMIYGANRSLAAFVRNFPGEADLIFALNLRQLYTKKQIREYFGQNVGHIWFLPQPMRLTAIDDSFSWQIQLKCAIKDLLYALVSPLYRHIYRKGKYDFIHLNSIVLYPMLDKRYPMVIHVREIAKQEPLRWQDRSLPRQFEKAHGIIYIGEHFKNALPPFSPPCCVLRNPFDMTKVALVDEKTALETYRIPEGATVYAIIGTITPGKGPLFALECFRRAELQNAVLLIVGKDTDRSDYIGAVKKAASDSPRIRLTGEQADMSMIYRIADYVVRADAVVGPGRTEYEGLFSGCGVIMPGRSAADVDALQVSKELAEKVFVYPPRNGDELVRRFRETEGKKAVLRQYVETATEYGAALCRFIQDCVSDEDE